MKHTKNLHKITLALLITAGTSTQTFAAEDRISDAITPGDTNSKWVVGGTLGAVEHYLVGEDEDTQGIFNINIEYRGEKFYAGKEEVGYNLFRNNGFSAGIALAGIDSPLWDKEIYEDNAVISHLEERDSTLDMGVYLIHNSDLGQLRVRLLEEVTGKHSGHSLDASYTFDFKYGDWNVNPYVSATYLSEESVDYFFGIEQPESTADLATYQGEDTVNVTVGISARYAITNHWVLGLSAHTSKLGDGIANSSLLKSDTICATGLTLNYNF